MLRKKWYSIIFSILANLPVWTALGQSTINGELAVKLNPEGQDAKELVFSKEWTEDVSQRTLTSSTYYNSDGEIRIRQSSRPINYINKEGILVPIDPVPARLENGWAAVQQPYPTYLKDNGDVSITLNDATLFTMKGSPELNGRRWNAIVSHTEGDYFYQQLTPQVRKELFFRENGVKYNYVLDSPLASVQNDLVISETIVLPEGFSMVPDEENGILDGKGWSGLLNVKDGNGKVTGTIHEAVCFDANNTFFIAKYKIAKVDEEYKLLIIIDDEWINDPTRAYPITIDPIITGPTTTWTGGQMPSCFMPAFNADSILVNIPGGITITMLNITASFYADPWTGAWMQDGAMYFSTSCNNSQNFTITGPSGQTAGTAYLDYFNIYNPLTCCFAESCNPQSFWLTYHLGRNLWGSGCNTTYIRYDPVTTSWPFEAEIIGKTPESYSAQWSVPSAPICANQCEITGIAYANYGVAPYTFTHPWSNDTITQGTNIGCGTGATTAVMNLTIPNCPVYCDTINTTLTVPPPVIIDACGNTVQGLPDDTTPLKPVPSINQVYDSIICSGEPLFIDLTPCIPSATVTWIEDWTQNTGNLYDTIYNSASSEVVKNYTAFATLNGCTSDTFYIGMHIQPLPIPSYTTTPNPVVSGVQVDFSDATNFNSANGVIWQYDLGDGSVSPDPDFSYTYGNPGDYTVCLYVEDDMGCTNEICSILPVVPAELVLPNVVTANDDQLNDLLAFQYLDFYPKNHLTVLDRWGVVVFETDDYTNDWNPKDLTEGVYYYILEVLAIEKKYDGFFHLIK